MTTEPISWRLECHNEWCSGPEKWGRSAAKPQELQRCPACGWPAKVGSGIVAQRALVEGESDGR